MTPAEAVVGARYRSTGGRVIHIVGEVGPHRLAPLCKAPGGVQYRHTRQDFRHAHIADPAALARWPMCAECERRATEAEAEDPDDDPVQPWGSMPVRP
jgi:hypothetical protein